MHPNYAILNNNKYILLGGIRMMPDEINRIRRGFRMKIGIVLALVVLFLAYGVPVIRPIDTSVYTLPETYPSQDAPSHSPEIESGDMEGNNGDQPQTEHHRPSYGTAASPADASPAASLPAHQYSGPAPVSSADLSTMSCPIWAEPAKVITVSDGDTLFVELKDGSQRHVRLLEVNTPESKAESVGYAQDTVYGDFASQFTKEVISNITPSGQDVVIFLSKELSDSPSDEDRYGRLLRIAWLSCPSDNARSDSDEIRENTLQGRLLNEGYAEAVYYDDYGYRDVFDKIEKEAREAKRGLWEYGDKAFEKLAF